MRNFINEDTPLSIIGYVCAALETKTSEIGGKNVAYLDKGILEAWKAIVDANNIGTAFARDYPLLLKIKEIKTDSSKLAAFNTNTIPNFDEFLIAYNKVPCNTCGTAAGLSSYFPKLDEILDNTIKSYKTHKSTTGFSTFYAREPVNKGNDYAKDGGQHMLKYMIDNKFTDNAIGFDGVMSNGSQYDIYIGDNATIRYVECKSYQEQTDLNTTKGVNQLIGYLKEPKLDELSQLRYVFNAKKINETQAKEKMHAVFRIHAIDLFNAKPSLFETIEISEGKLIRTAKILDEFANSTELDAVFKQKVLQFVIIN